jgi:type IV secretory pathway VirB10-like protein
VPAPTGAEGQPPPGASRPDADGTYAHSLRLAPSPWTLSAGTVIPASLITGLNSDLPGIVIAQVTEHVRDSATGATILVPQGSRLIGSYESGIAFGQSRALLAWKRIVFPDASSIQLDDVPATDRSGRSGVRDRVNFHGFRLLKGIALSTLLGVGTELQFRGRDGGLAEAVRRSAQQDSARAGEQLTSRNLDIAPTIEVRPGWPVNAILHKDLVLRPWKG